MARPKKENTRKSIFGNKLEAIAPTNKIIRLSEYFGIGLTAVSKYLNGDSSPSMTKLQELVLNYAAANEMKRLDLNWLLNDNDRRPGPVFVGENTKDVHNSTVPNPLSLDHLADLQAPPGSRPMSTGNSFDKAVEWWEDNQPMWVVRGAAAADDSGGMRVPDSDDIVDPITPPTGITLVPVQGDSMEPVLLDGQYAIIDKERAGFEEDGGIVVAVVVEDETTYKTYIKRCRRRGEDYMLQSINNYPPIPVRADRCHIWPVIGVWFAGKGKIPKED